jgi:hypothetical protein
MIDRRFRRHGPSSRFPVGWWSATPMVSRSSYVYSRENEGDARMAKVLTPDEARRIASNIAKLPTLLGGEPK